MKVPAARKLASGNWFIQLRLGGESIPVTERTEKECKRKAQMIKAEYLAGKRQPPTPKEEKLPTVSEAIDAYIEAKSNILSPSTIRGYRTIQRTRFKGMMNQSLSDITDNDWIAACNAEAAICSAKTLSNAWRFLVSVVKFTTKETLPDVTLPQIVPNERPFLTADQIKVFIQAVHGTDIEIPALLALSSLRRSEVYALSWENVDLKNRILRVKGSVVLNEDGKFIYKKENKNKSSTRVVPILIDNLYNALERDQRPSGLVVSSDPNSLRQKVNRICAKNNLPSVGVHGLRHSFASLAYHLGVPEKVTMEIGGWSDNHTMRKIYTHIAQSDVERYEAEFIRFFKNANENANRK